MKHFTKFFALLVVALFTTIGASAADLLSPGWQELSNYTEDFSSAKVTSSKFTALPDYWSVVGTGAVWGVSSGYITCANDQTSNTTDYLVTPQVKGEISVKARYSYWAASSSGSGYGHITVYEATEEDGVMIPGDRVLDQELGDYSSFTKFTIVENATEYKQYMIHLSGAYMDDFAASSAYVNVPEVRVLTPTAITGEWTDNNPIYADAEGKGAWTGTITVKNEGNVAFAPGDENFSLTVASQSTYAVTTTMATFAIPEALAIGEEKTFDVSVPLQLVDITADGRTAIRFTTNLLAAGNTASSSASYKQSNWFTLKTQAPKLYVKNANDSNVESYETALGLVSAPASTTFTLRNDGGSPVVLKSIASTFENATWTVDGAAVEFPYTIAKGETKTFTLTLNATGGQSSTLTFNYGNTYDEAEYTVVSKTVSAVVADPSLYLENFDSYLTVPTGWCQPGWINETGSNWSFSSSSSNTFATNGVQAIPGKYLISPKLTFSEGQTLTVSAVPGSTYTYSSNQTFLKVLYSTDRVNWNVAKVIAMADTRDAVVGYEDKFMEWGSFGGTTIAYAKAFVIDGIPAGDYYIGFESGYAKIDYIFGGVLATLDNDFYINSVDVVAEKTGMVNYPVTVTANYTNMLATASKAHKVVLLDGETVLTEQEVAAIDAYAAATPVEFTFTPHETGTLNLQVKVVVAEDSYEAASAVIEKVIKEETASAEVQVGTKTGMTNTVIGQNYNRYRTEWIWTADDLGLTEGTVITSLTLKYYSTSKDVTKKAKIYLMSTDDAEVSGTAFTPVAELTPNFSDDEYVMAKAGSSTEPAEMKFVFDAPYTYDGKNIRVVTDFNGSSYTSIYFETAAGKSLYYRADGSTDTSDSNTATSGSVIPVGYLGYAVSVPEITGTVKDADTKAAIEGATVELKSGDVIYTATTDAEGAYSVAVYQSDKEYAVTVSCENYEDLVVEAKALTEIAKDYELKSLVITIDQDVDVVTTAKADATVVLKRKFVAGWNTICVPFAVTDIEATFGEGVQAVGLASVKTDENVLHFTETATMDANTPYLIYFPEATSDPITIEGVDVVEATPVSVTVDGVSFVGNYSAHMDMEGKYGVTGDKIRPGAAGSFIRATRAYIVSDSDLSEARVAFHFEGDTTGLDEIFNGAQIENQVIYDLQGRRVNTPSKGIYVVNGKKVIFK